MQPSSTRPPRPTLIRPAEGPPIIAEGKVIWPDFLAAQHLHFAKDPWRRAFQVVFVLSIVVVFLYGLYGLFGTQDENGPSYLSIGFAFAAVGFLFWEQRYGMPRRVRRQYDQNSRLREPFRITLDDAGLTCVTPSATTERPWNHFVMWKESEELLLLYQTEVTFTMIPKGLFDSVETAARASRLVRGKLGPAR